MTEDATVLIVDDEEEVANTYSEALDGQYAVHTTYSGEQALETMDSTVDVVLLDRRMPGMSGDEVLEQMRTRDYDCRVVMVTAVEPDSDIIAMEFDEYLVKPVTATQLRDVVERMLAREKLDEQIRRIMTTGSRLATLEAKLDYEQLQDSEEYATLRDEFHELREKTELDDDSDDPYLEATIENIEALLRNTR